MSKENSSNKPDKKLRNGFIQIILVIVIALILLRVANINVLDILSRPWAKDLVINIKDMLKLVWADLVSIFDFFLKA